MASAEHGPQQPIQPQDIRLVVDTIPGLVWSTLPDGSAEFFNQRWLEYTGISAVQALDWGWKVAIHPDDLPRLLEAFREALNLGRSFEVEGRFRRWDGEFRWFLFRGNPLLDASGKVVRWYGTNTDLEDRKRTEEALRDSEQSLRLILDGIPGLVGTTTATGELELVNRQLLDYFGKTFEELKAWSTSDAIHPDDLPSVISAWRRSVETVAPYDVDHRFRRADGVYHWFHARGLPLCSAKGRIVRWYVLLTDIEERKQAEEKRRQSEADLHEAQRLAHIGSWKLHVSSGEVTVSPEILRRYGVRPEEDTSRAEFWFNRIHPEDRKRVRVLFEKCLIDRTDYESEYRIVLPNGAIKYQHSIGRPIMNEAGDVFEFVGTTMEVTEQALAKAELEKALDRQRLLLDMTNTLVSNLEPRDLLRAISASIRKDIRCDVVGVWLPDSAQTQLRLCALDFPESKGFAREDILRSVDESYLGTPFRTGKAVIGTAADFTTGQSPAAARGEAILSSCSLPLISRNRTLGVLTLASRAENSFRPEDVDFLVRAAGQVAVAIENALAYREIAELKDKLAKEKLYLEEEIRTAGDFEGIVGQSSALQQVLQLVETVAISDSTVLLLGETGTGKELIAQAIHDRSRRKDRTLIKLNCAAIPTGLLESEFFGYERGAFTGAVTQKIGRLELADQGTLFLDEVGDIPLELQPKLLRALQDGEFERLGSTRTKKVDVRLVAATNRNLDQMMEERQFRSDLYYRLNVFPIRIPPLRERPEDIPLLVQYFSQKYARRMQKRIEDIPAAAMRKLARWHWPGNVRELQNLVERAVILTRSSTLAISVPELAYKGANLAPARASDSDEQARIVRILRETKGRVGGPKGAAARMGLKRTTLITRMNKLGINPRQVS